MVVHDENDALCPTARRGAAVSPHFLRLDPGTGKIHDEPCAGGCHVHVHVPAVEVYEFPSEGQPDLLPFCRVAWGTIVADGDGPLLSSSRRQS